MLYQSTAAWANGLPAYSSPDTPTTNLNHPLVWLLLLPFLRLAPGVAFTCWTLLSLALLAGAALPVSRAVGMRMLDVVVITLALTGTAFGLALGQLSFVLMLLLTGAWWLDRQGHEVAAGACIGVLCVLKPFYGPMAVMLVWRGAWRGVFACAATALATIASGWVLAGTEGYQAWLQNLRNVTWTWHVFNGSIWGASARLFEVQQLPIATAWTPLLDSPPLALVVAVFGSLLTLTFVYRGANRADIDGTYALVSLGSLLLSPLGWVYYLASSLGPVLATLARRPSPWLWLLVALAVVPYGTLVNRAYGVVATASVGQISFFVLSGLFVLVYANARSPRQAAFGGRTAGVDIPSTSGAGT